MWGNRARAHLPRGARSRPEAGYSTCQRDPSYCLGDMCRVTAREELTVWCCSPRSWTRSRSRAALCMSAPRLRMTIPRASKRGHRARRKLVQLSARRRSPVTKMCLRLTPECGAFVPAGSRLAFLAREELVMACFAGGDAAHWSAWHEEEPKELFVYCSRKDG